MQKIYRNSARAVVALLLSTAAHPALAELPANLKAVIDAAIKTGDTAKVAAVMDAVKAASPENADDIAAIETAFAAEQATKAADAAAAKAAADKEAQSSAGLLENWSGDGQIGAFLSSGNSKTSGISLGVNLLKIQDGWRHKITAATDFQRTNGVTSREQYFLAYEPNVQVNGRIYAYGLSQYERDVFQGYSSRITVSGGLGYRVVENDKMHLFVKAGPALRKTSYVTAADERYMTGHGALDFSWKISDTLKLTENATAFLHKDNSTFSSDTGLEVALGSNLTARIGYSVRHDTKPPLGFKGTDTLTRFTLMYGF